MPTEEENKEDYKLREKIFSDLDKQIKNKEIPPSVHKEKTDYLKKLQEISKDIEIDEPASKEEGPERFINPDKGKQKEL